MSSQGAEAMQKQGCNEASVGCPTHTPSHLHIDGASMGHAAIAGKKGKSFVCSASLEKRKLMFFRSFFFFLQLCLMHDNCATETLM